MNFSELQEIIQWNKKFGITQEDTINDLQNVRNIQQYKSVLKLQQLNKKLKDDNEELREKLSHSCDMIKYLLGFQSDV